MRFRAWWPPSALHPTISPHVPLTFDLVDTWNGAFAGGIPLPRLASGGRNFEIFPINAYEAEGRRLARFEAIGHSAGRFTAQNVERNPDYPMTLDLRRT